MLLYPVYTNLWMLERGTTACEKAGLSLESHKHTKLPRELGPYLLPSLHSFCCSLKMYNLLDHLQRSNHSCL